MADQVQLDRLVPAGPVALQLHGVHSEIAFMIEASLRTVWHQDRVVAAADGACRLEEGPGVSAGCAGAGDRPVAEFADVRVKFAGMANTCGGGGIDRPQPHTGERVRGEGAEVAESLGDVTPARRVESGDRYTICCRRRAPVVILGAGLVGRSAALEAAERATTRPATRWTCWGPADASSSRPGSGLWRTGPGRASRRAGIGRIQPAGRRAVCPRCTRSRRTAAGEYTTLAHQNRASRSRVAAHSSPYRRR